MSNISDTATVTLLCNGAQAKKVIDDLKNEIDKAKKKLQQLEDAKASPKDIEKARKEVRKLEKQLEETRSAAETVNNALENLDKVSLRDLEKTLKTLNRQFKNAKQGTEVYQDLAEKIRIVKEQISAVKSELSESESMWGRFKRWSMEAWPALDLLKGWYDGAISTMRGFVDAYAEMDQEMASVRKFTGMTEAQVTELNKQFKTIDTRSSREELNKLAQDAGRLGKNSVEDVMGFVRAADKINVALDDLGDGATLTLSKLTGIFGYEEQYGTEQSLLKVGSVINELSQNCSASAPYIANFTERMAGVGAQANMTIPQIMGFAAVLDSNSQKVEASATALSQVIVRLYQDPAKYAKVAGLDVKEFSDLLKKDANEALILFLETLNNAGGMDVLSPMFKDMGENGSRAIAALSTLANKIEDVKSQQAVANDAFIEGTSIGTEFDVQNNTVAAGLDKCRNAAHEYQVELGERLYPLMSHFLSSSAAVARGLLTVLRYLFDHKGAVFSLTAAIAAYTVVAKGSAMVTAASNTVIKAGEGAANAARAAILALRVGYYQLTDQTRKAAVATRAFNSVSKASPLGIVAGLLTAVVGAMITYIHRTIEARRAVEKARKEEEEWRKSLVDVSEAAARSAASEESRVKSLYQAAIDQAKSTDERRKAAEKLQALYPDYFKNLSAEEIMVGNARKQYDDLRESIINTARAKAAASKIEQNEEEILTLESNLDKERKTRQQRQKEYNSAAEKHKQVVANYSKQEKAAARIVTPATSAPFAAQPHVSAYVDAANAVRTADANLKAATDAVSETQRKIDALNAANRILAEKYEVSVISADDEKPKTFGSAQFSDGDGDPKSLRGNSSPAQDRFEKEKAWRTRMEAEARIAYAKGETTLTEHNENMASILANYHQMILDREDLSTDERLSAQADYWEAVNKLDDAGFKNSESEENEYYASRLEYHNARYKEILESESLSAEERKAAEKVHQETMEREELEHLARLVEIYEEGSEDHLKARKKHQDAELAAARRHQQEFEALEAEFAQIKKQYFGNNPAEDKALYDKHLASLSIVYERELQAAEGNAAEKLRIEKAFLEAQAALRKMYNQESESDTRNSMQKAVESSVEWLNSDGGKALTGSLSTLTSGMSSIFSGLSTMIQSELQIQTASIEARYDRELKYAEGNSYRVAKLEKQKEAEIAKAKNEANKKMFAMQVIQAVAQTATNALNAYGSAAAVPVVGHILAPIAAAMAVAAGAIQIAAIKKQQQASETQGYSKGGFTKPGGVDEPAGIVHAGEWVASQKLLASPVARPMIEALDYAQRTNTIGSLRSEDVSRSITAPQTISRIAGDSASAAAMAAVMASNADVINRLAQRLDEPFVTINTVTGPYGINQSLDEYTMLMNNKSPKSRRKSYADNN